MGPNTATAAVGGWAAVGTGPLDVSSSVFTGNEAVIVGGLYSAVTTSLVDTTVESNAAQRAGGLQTETGASLTVVRSAILANTADTGTGGGLFTQGPTEVHDSRLAANTAAVGAGMAVLGTPVTIDSSTLDTNVAGTVGGGLAVGPTTAATLVNSTVSGNEAPAGAGVASAGTLALDSVTVSANVGTALHTLGAGEMGFGMPAGTTTATNTVVGPTSGADCGGGGSLTSLGHNLEDGASCGFTAPGDLQGQDPQLGALDLHGRAAPTQVPAPGSPLVDSGATSQGVDQRGAGRPVGAAPDIGAVEVQGTTALGVGRGANFLGTGNDPGDAIPGALHENLWLAVSGPCASAENGDGLQAITDATYVADGAEPDANPGALGASISWKACRSDTSEDTTDGQGGDLYDPTGYLYSVEVAPAMAGGPLAIEIFDAPQCNDGSGPLPTSQAHDGWNRNLGTGGPADHVTRYRVLGPDTTPGDPSDNPVVAGPRQMRGNDDAWCGTATTDWQNRWKPLFTTPSAVAGTYLVQVQSDSDTDPDNAPSTTGDDDNHNSNQFSLRAHHDTSWDPLTSPCQALETGSTYFDPACPAISAPGWAGAFVNLGDTYPDFGLGSVQAPGGSTLVIDVWDPGEGTIGLEVLDPLGRSVDFSWEVVDRSGHDVAPTAGRSGTVTQPGGVPCTEVVACRVPGHARLTEHLLRPRRRRLLPGVEPPAGRVPGEPQPPERPSGPPQGHPPPRIPSALRGPQRLETPLPAGTGDRQHHRPDDVAGLRGGPRRTASPLRLLSSSETSAFQVLRVLRHGPAPNRPRRHA